MARAPRLRRARWVLGGAAAAAIICAAHIVVAFAVPLPARLSAPGSTVIEYRDGTPAHVVLSPDDKWRIAARPGEVDERYVRALLRLEDKRYYTHPGVDPLAIARAVYLNLSQQRVVSGGSTITMQLARVLEPRPRTVRSKVVEALRALQLELHMSKEEILAAYLTFIPFGKNLEGVEVGSLAYFGHGARTLSNAEIATLLAVPQDPTRRYPRPQNRARLRQARDRIIGRLAAYEVLAAGAGRSVEQALRQAQATVVPQRLHPFPRRALHAAAWLPAPSGTRMRTTLDRGSQRLAEKLLAAARSRSAAKGVHNAAVVVVDHRSSEIRALVGNFDFWDEANAGQIIGFDVPRSPGSALKPILYAMALDRGLMLPETLIPDIPRRFGTYAPQNFEGQFSGLVPAEQALARSLNLPFVRLLEQVGVEQLLAALRSMGVASLRDEPGFYGLSAIIGGIEVTPLEVTGLYATLARGGRSLPLRWLASDTPPADPAPGVISPGAAFLTQRALYLRNRPDLPDERRETRATVPIAWKTGTSFGHRDAWAVGSGPSYTAAVWAGNFDRTPSRALVGAQVAGPILFDLLETLEPDTGGPLPLPVPRAIKQLEVCAYSGLPPTDACPELRTVAALRHHVPTDRCPYHQLVDVDRETGLALSAACRAGRSFERKTFLTWPSSVRRWLNDNRGKLHEAPALAPGCTPGGRRQAPAIISPPAGQKLILVAGVAASDQEIPLEADTTSARELSWFVDGEFLGRQPSHRRLWWTPSPGVHEIVVVDDAGLSAQRMLAVLRGR